MNVKQKTRYSLLAAALSFSAPGLGHLYVGRAKRFLVPAGGLLVVVLFLGSSGALSSFYGMVAYLGLFLALFVHGIVDSSIVAHRIGVFELRWYCRWYIYLAWFLLLIAFSIALPLVRESLLGFSTFRVPTASMVPTIEPQDVILVDTRAFRNAPPKVGDVVVVYVPEFQNNYARRVSALPTPDTVSFESDSPSGKETELTLKDVPLDNVVGRITYVLFSRTNDRIGHAIQ